LHIPAYQPLPPQSKKMKFRSVGLKKREMVQFTELNRYKNLLMILTELQDRDFLVGFAKNIRLTVRAVGKSKQKEMQNSRLWLGKLLAMIDGNLMRIKEKDVVKELLEE
jgi:hypothetical protein